MSDEGMFVEFDADFAQFADTHAPIDISSQAVREPCTQPLDYGEPALQLQHWEATPVTAVPPPAVIADILARYTR